MVKETEFYELLDVRVDAEEHEIKRSYRRLALKYHPDKNQGDENAAEMFKKISLAYETLSDAEKRKLYDSYGKEGLNGGPGGEGGFHDPSDIFSMFFGGGARPRGEPKPKDLVHELPCTLEDLYKGRTRRVQVSRTRACAECAGKGLRPGVKPPPCQTCRGTGVRRHVQQLFPGFAQQVEMQCDVCGGLGERVRPGDRCRTCGGQGMMNDKKVLEVVVEKGAKHHDVIRFSGEGDQKPGVRLMGDVLIFLEEQPHPTFKRVGKHLVLNVAVTLAEALCGIQIPVKQLDGREILLRQSPGVVIDPDTPWCVAGQGMPVPGTGGTVRGNLYVHFSVSWPRVPSGSTAGEGQRGGSSSSPLSAAATAAIAKAFDLPEKPPLVGGRRVELQRIPSKEDEQETARTHTARAGGGRQGSGARRTARSRGGAGDAALYDEDARRRYRAVRSAAERAREATRAKTAAAARNEEDDEDYEDVEDDDDDDDDDDPRARFMSGGGGGGGEFQTVQCANQ